MCRHVHVGVLKKGPLSRPVSSKHTQKADGRTKSIFSVVKVSTIQVEGATACPGLLPVAIAVVDVKDADELAAVAGLPAPRLPCCQRKIGKP